MQKYYSTNETCKILGVSAVTLYRHIRRKTFEAPPIMQICGIRVRAWTPADIEKARAVLKKFKV